MDIFSRLFFPYWVEVASDRGIPAQSDWEDATPWRFEHASAGWIFEYMYEVLLFLLRWMVELGSRIVNFWWGTGSSSYVSVFETSCLIKVSFFPPLYKHFVKTLRIGRSNWGLLCCRDVDLITAIFSPVLIGFPCYILPLTLSSSELEDPVEFLL